jgi:hypothetical protein
MIRRRCRSSRHRMYHMGQRHLRSLRWFAHSDRARGNRTYHYRTCVNCRALANQCDHDVALS